MKLQHTITEGGDEVDFDSLDKKQQNKIKAAHKPLAVKDFILWKQFMV